MTIKDVARLSDYSVATVSRTLNNSPDVSEKARISIMAVVNEHNFRLNGNAKHLKQQISTGVAIIVKGTQNMFFARILEQAQAGIRAGGYNSSVYYLDENENEVYEALRICMERKPQGILFLGGNIDCFKESFSEISIPCVLLTNTAAQLGFENLSSYTTDDRQAADKAVEFLISMGHKKICVLGGDSGSSQISSQRLKGCEDAFSRHSISFDREKQCQTARFSIADAYSAMEVLYTKMPDLTAVFAMSDVMAIGAIRALSDLGRRVPEDVSVMGYDGVELGHFSTPRLATVRQDADYLALNGVERLLEQIKSGTIASKHKLAPFEICPAESVISI